MRMFQVTSQAHFMVLILHGSTKVQLTAVNALPQPSNVQERQFATQMEHARVNIEISITLTISQKYCTL